MVLDQCQDCGLIQVLAPVDPEELYRDFNFCFSSWKPQPHMSDEIELLRRRIPTDALVVEIGANDGTFLHLLGEAGYERRVGVEPNRVASELARKTGATICNEFFDAALAEKLASEHGPAALVVSRQAVEHIANLDSLGRGLTKLLAEDGWVLFEVPDFDVPMPYGDVSALWEEHVNYFTEATMTRFLARHGIAVQEVRRYPFSGGALTVLARRGSDAQACAAAQAEKDRARAFAASAASFRHKIEARLRANRRGGRANILYGTGCRANMLINGFKLQGLFDFVADDQPEKQGLYMPGTSLRIHPGSEVDAFSGDCFLAVNAENEEKVIAARRAFTERGGRFFSLHSPSPRLRQLEIEKVA